MITSWVGHRGIGGGLWERQVGQREQQACDSGLYMLREGIVARAWMNSRWGRLEMKRPIRSVLKDLE